MYVAVKGGERAIENSLRLLREERRGDKKVPEISTRQISEQLGLAVARVMAEASLYCPDLAALAIKQAQGDLIEAIFLLRAFRTTLPRFGFSEPLDTGKMALCRRISSTFKDLPGGQVLGPSYDYSHRLLDFSLTEQSDENEESISDDTTVEAMATAMPRVFELLGSEELVEREEDPDPTGAVSIPGYQVPFGSREMPLPYGWGTGGIQVTASIIGPDDVLKVIDQGADDTTNAVNIRRFIAFTAGVANTTRTEQATLIQTRHRIPERPLRKDQILIYQVPIPEPLRFLIPRESETRKMHALRDYGVMHVKLYEDISRHGAITTSYNYPVVVNERYVMAPSPIPKFDNPKMNRMPALQLFGAGREKRIYAIPPYTRVRSLDFEDYPFQIQRWDVVCSLCGSKETFLDEIVINDRGGRMFICSDSDYCREKREAGVREESAV